MRNSRNLIRRALATAAACLALLGPAAADAALTAAGIASAPNASPWTSSSSPTVGTPNTVATTAAVSAGHSIWAFLLTASSITSPTVTDDAGNFYTLVDSGVFGSQKLWVFRSDGVAALSSGANIKVYWSTAASKSVFVAVDVGGAQSAGSFDAKGAFAAASSGASTTISAVTASPTVSPSLAFCVVGLSGSNGGWLAGPSTGTWSPTPASGGFSSGAAVGNAELHLFWDTTDDAASTAPMSCDAKWTTARTYGNNIYFVKDASAAATTSSRGLLLGILP